MMRGYPAHTIAAFMDGEILQGDANAWVDHILTDSRKLVFPSTTAFFALNTGRRDGHNYVDDLYHQGVRVFIISDPGLITCGPGVVLISVGDTLQALQKLAAAHRSRFSYPVIGITGSNGKTIIKEWMNHLLQPLFHIVRSPRSYNSQVGVPLSVWLMQADHDMAIFEAGISTTGEMQRLEPIIRPTIGLLTNIGSAHDEGFRSRQEKLREKLKLFRNTPILIYNADQELLTQELALASESGLFVGRCFTWGRSGQPDILISDSRPTAQGMSITVTHKGVSFSFHIPFQGPEAQENAMHCLALMLYLGCKTDLIIERMASLPALAMRLDLKPGINRCIIINDSYSADKEAIYTAVEFLSRQTKYQKHTVILSDIQQTGLPEAELYTELGKMMAEKKVDRLIGVGPAIGKHAAAIDQYMPQTAFFPTTEAFLDQLHTSDFRDEAILVKGARSFSFERICTALEQSVHQTVLEINLSAIRQNLTTYRQALPAHVKLMVMVKAFSYGAGSYEIASLLQFHRVDFLAVAYADEGVELRKAGIVLPIVVMNAEPHSFQALVDVDLQPVIYSPEILEQFSAFLLQEGISEYPVHIKMDTGMNRLGFDPEAMGAVGAGIRQQGLLRVLSVFSHLAAAEDPLEDAFTRQQAALFELGSTALQEGLGYRVWKHLANSAAIRRHPELHYDMVRLGIGLYGVDVGGREGLNLRHVSTLRTTIAQIRKVAAGQTVGYNRKGRVTRDSLIAVLRIGYADGFPRILSNGKGFVAIRGKRYPVIGQVCMDMTMVDITGSNSIQAGDEVEVFGEHIKVEEMAVMSSTIPYEILTGISHRVKRVYFEE